MPDSIRPNLSTVKPARKLPISGAEVLEFEDSILSESGAVPEQFELQSVIPGIYYIDNVLTCHECDTLCKNMDKSQSLTFWSSGDQSKEEYRMFRNATTIEINSTKITDVIWTRVQLAVSELIVTIEDDEESLNHERELVGSWSPVALNHEMLLAKYPSRGSFAPHTDGRTIHDFNTRSFFSVIVFLNDIPEGQGGGTRFYQSDAVNNLVRVSLEGDSMWSADVSLVTAEVHAVKGRMLIFHQSLVHEGVPPLVPFEKYIIRSDLMLRRDQPVCDSEQDKAAYALFRQAEDLADAGDVQQSVVLFKRALRLSPAMAAIMGQA